MSGFIAKIVFKKILGETLENKKGTEDPYFEYVPAKDISQKPSKKLKRQKKALPRGISDHDAKVLTKVKRRAYRLDNNINICGLRFGWSSIIGIFPGFGDFLDFALAYMVFKTCNQVEGGLPSSVKSKMMINMLVDFVVGLIPFFGDVADALFRCNTKNAILLEKYLTKKYEGESRLRTNDVETRGDRLQEPTDSPPSYATNPPDRTRREEPRRPDRVATNKSRKSGRWYSGRGSRREPDLERGEEPEYEYRPAQPPRPRP